MRSIFERVTDVIAILSTVSLAITIGLIAARAIVS